VEAPVESEQTKAVLGGAVTLGGHVAVQAVRLGGQIVLTRLLPQEAFGLMAIVHTYRGMIDLFSDVGIGPSIIQNERGDEPRFLDTAWTIQFVRGTALFIVGALTAPLVARFYGHEALAWLIPAASLAAIIAGGRSTKAYAVERHLRLGWLTINEIVAAVAALIVMISWSLIEPSVWALVAGGLVGAGTDVLLGHLVLRGYNARFGWEKRAAMALLQFGKWVFLSTMLTFVVNEADRLIFGKMTSLTELGIYNVALTIALVPTAAMHALAGKVIFPLFSRINQTGEDLAAVFGKARRLHLVVSGWALSGLIGGGQAAIGLVYDDRYAAGGWMLQLLALAAWIATPEVTNSSASLALGRPRWMAAGNLGKLIGMILLLPLGYHLGGFRGALLGYVGSELFRYAASTLGVYRRGLSTVRQDLECSGVVLVASFAAHSLVAYLSAQQLPALVQASGVFVVVTAIWGPWLFPYAKPVLDKVRHAR
jgi:O-antigen/teichoic acid export membrane protein